MDQKNMTVQDHIQELRKRVIAVILFFVVAIVIALFFAEPVILYLQRSGIAKDLQLHAFRITDPLKIYIQMAFIIACVITLPFILYQLWAFVAPGLYEKERKITLSYIPVSIILFLAGILFSYFILFPFVLRFMGNLGEKMEINSVIGINEYFQFLFQLTIPFGFLFQMPVVIMFLTRLGIISPALLVKIRKYAYFVLLIIAALITPPDVFSLILITLPLLFLYELSIWISKISGKESEQSAG